MKFGLNNYLYSVIVHLFYSYVVDCTLIDALGRPSKASSTELQVTCYGDIELTEVLDYTELHNDTDRHPVKRAAPTLADLLRRAYKNPGKKDNYFSFLITQSKDLIPYNVSIHYKNMLFSH